MKLEQTIKEHDLILAEASVIEALRRSGKVDLHPRLEHALLVYDDAGKRVLTEIHRNYISFAQKTQIPIMVCAPTWRANYERISEASIQNDVNGDAVKYLLDLKAQWGAWAKNIIIGGLVGCKHDTYRPQEGLSVKDAEKFHAWQVDRQAEAGVDFLLAATLPAVPEATGIALAMGKTAVPYFIGFVINRHGYILDGTSLEKAFLEIDAATNRPPLGYMINCSYPSFLNVKRQPETVRSRLIGFQANASSLDHSELDGIECIQADDINDWGMHMIELYRKFGVKILGGCCGTGLEHLKYIVENIQGISNTAHKNFTGNR
jgi:S-methylmethionine-dependent homocysteine/selenocysteine methylase